MIKKIQNEISTHPKVDYGSKLHRHTLIGMVIIIILIVEAQAFGITHGIGIGITSLLLGFGMGMFYYPIGTLLYYIGIPVGIFITSKAMSILFAPKIQEFQYIFYLMLNLMICTVVLVALGFLFGGIAV